ncbi:MAG: RNA 2',3'-cyclic phosphodiesterase [Candidatus Geothermarchaeales archaeon]
MVRAFVAVEASNPRLTQTIREIQRELSALPGRISMVDPNRVHITLKFLGEVSERRISEVREKLSRINQKKFVYRVDGMGFFPSGRRPRVVFLDVTEGRETLIDLAGKVEDAMQEVGFPRERRPFSPHVTIARVKTPLFKPIPERVRRMGEDIGIDIDVEEVKLKKSTLTPKGPLYTDIYVVRLME